MSENAASTPEPIKAAAPPTARWGAWAPGSGISWPMSPAYKGAAGNLFGRGNILFQPNLSSINVEVVRERRQAVANARHVDRNNQQMHAGLTKRAMNLVGPRIQLQPAPNFRALGLTPAWAVDFTEQFSNEWNLWADDPRMLCDAYRHQQFGEIMLTGARQCFGTEGEVGLIIRDDENRRVKYRGRHSTFVELVTTTRIRTPDHLTEGEQPNGDFIIDGKRLDGNGAMLGFWVERDDMPQSRLSQQRFSYVPRETDYGRPVGVHWFPKLAAEQQRGMPAIIACLKAAKWAEKLTEQKIKQALLTTFLSMYVKTDKTTSEVVRQLQAAPDGKMSSLEELWNAKFDLYDEMELSVEGQTLPVMGPGDEIAIAQANGALHNEDTFLYALERGMWANLGLSYASGGNDFSKTSFASIRAELIDMWRIVNGERYMFTQHTCSLVALALLEECIAWEYVTLPAGAPDLYEMPSAYAQADWRGPGMGWVDPVKDVQGAGMRIAAGLSSPQDEAAAQGTDWRDNIDKRAIAEAYAEKANVKITYTGVNGLDPNAAEPVDQAGASGGDPASEDAARQQEQQNGGQKK